MRALGILIVSFAIAVTTTANAKQPPCPGGRYLVSGPPLVGSLDGAPMDVVDMAGKMIGGARSQNRLLRSRISSRISLAKTILKTRHIAMHYPYFFSVSASRSASSIKACSPTICTKAVSRLSALCA